MLTRKQKMFVAAIALVALGLLFVRVWATPYDVGIGIKVPFSHKRPGDPAADFGLIRSKTGAWWYMYRYTTLNESQSGEQIDSYGFTMFWGNQ